MTLPSEASAATHEVLNQPPPLEGWNLYEQDLALTEAVGREGAASFESALREYGALAGSELLPLGFQANTHLPVLRTHDRYGHRVDEVEFHPAYHELMNAALSRGMHALPWQAPRPGSQVARAAFLFLHHQVDSGTCCPISMAYACIPLLRVQPEVASEWEERALRSEYDPRNLPARDKRAVTVGLTLTEKQGGSDLRGNTTVAHPVGPGGPGRAYEIVGHKWFCSAPMCDAFFILARTAKGPSAFLLPRWRDDGTRNAFHIQRLKDKVGNRSNASSEVEFNRAHAVLVGEEGRGIRTVFEMLSLTRLDCLIGSAALMRQGVAQATHHAAHREAFGKRLSEQPLMQNVLADLALESEAATALAFRVARALDEAEESEEQRAFFRAALAVSKYWVCKRAPAHTNEAQECLGGAGFVEESILPRLYRDAPLNSIWEGSGNVLCLDVMRAMVREPESVEAFLTEMRSAKGGDRRLEAFTRGLERELARPEDGEYGARRLAERMALGLQAALLVRDGDPAVADAFCASRLDGDRGFAFGTLPRGVDVAAIAGRARPRLS